MVDELHGSQIQLCDCTEAPAVDKAINAWMISQVNQRVRDATQALEGFQTRKALQEALFLFKKDIDHYLHRVDLELKSGDGREEIISVLAYVLGIWIRLMAPFTLMPVKNYGTGTGEKDLYPKHHGLNSIRI